MKPFCTVQCKCIVIKYVIFVMMTCTIIFANWLTDARMTKPHSVLVAQQCCQIITKPAALDRIAHNTMGKSEIASNLISDMCAARCMRRLSKCLLSYCWIFFIFCCCSISNCDCNLVVDCSVTSNIKQWSATSFYSYVGLSRSHPDVVVLYTFYSFLLGDDRMLLWR